ncbi:tyrosine-protein phosphatase [Streptomyces hoynatensis]|uniref:Tyrosine-protein phosphatase n=1 Tax=Streptomyces hoynatensis TaxID=1141874 RepID=A0A3A9YZN2_9ACTN|nr:tyrosine-protein phosphatase [Streptomyces hoynatensis]RKN41320.1 tyrosine-protein phosphatase [Streptomyces hoynatensis]
MTQQQSAEPVLAGVRNFRDLGGLPAAGGRRVRHGVLFRSGHLAQATAADRAFLTSLGLHTVFDFRNAADRALEGQDAALPGVRMVSLPLTAAEDGAEFWALVREGSLAELRAALDGGQAVGRMLRTYREIVLHRTAELGRVLRELSEGALPALLHCAAGKDRAGLTTALVLLAVGVDREAIGADYVESNAPHRRYPLRRGAGEGGGEPPAELAALLAPLFDARAEYLRAAFDQIDETWGGVDRYLTEALGLGPAGRERLQSRLLDER